MSKEKDFSTLSGHPVNIAPFGDVRYWTGADAYALEGHTLTAEKGFFTPQNSPEQGGLHIGIEWDVPKQFEKIVVRYAGNAPKTADVKLQYWNQNWPAAWRGGWTHIDDPHNGGWITAHTQTSLSGATVTYTFDPLDYTEIDRATEFPVSYRQAYRFRLLFRPDARIKIEGIQVYSTSTWQTASLQIDFDDGSKYQEKLSIRNGYLLGESAKGKRVVADVLYADCSHQIDEKLMPVPPDLTVLTVKAKPQDFSVSVQDVLITPMRIPDLGVTISNPDSKANFPQAVKAPIYERVKTEPEQTYARASAEIPHLVKSYQNRYVPLGCEANRQEFALRFNGHLFIDKKAMKCSGRDTARLLWPTSQIEYKFPTMDPPDFRERETGVDQEPLNGYLPIYTSRWKDREFVFEKTDFSALLLESPENEEAKRGDEPTCVFSRVKIRNASEDRRTARFWLVIDKPERLELIDGFVYATARIAADDAPWHLRDAPERRWTASVYESPRMRACFDIKGRGTLSAAACAYEPHMVSGQTNAIAYDVELEPRESHTIDIKIPFVTFVGDEGRQDVLKASFDAKLAEMTEYWQAQISAGADIHVPEQIITEFVKATIPHIGITVDKDIKTGYYLLPAATYHYNVCANEAAHQIRSLDYRGLHDRARKYLMPFVHCQGTRPLHGKFKTQEGVLHGLRVDEETDYQTFNYNLDHGFVLFALCEHYLLTRDRKWASSIAANLIAACDFVTRERQFTMKSEKPGERAPEYGLLPPGHLEDNAEWLYWYAVNAYCYRGMEATAVVLSDIGNPEAGRIARDAKAYRDDLRRSMRAHMERSPVTRLADGTGVPFTPTRAELYSRDLGWIRDSLYGPIHSIECGVLDANEDQSTWILKDSEDNVFVNKYRGRQVDLDRFWFSHGGNTIQSGLLPMVMVYVKRDQPEHAVRCLFNAFAQNIYRDVRCFTEHPVMAFGLGAGPFYKTPDECCWVNWLRNALLFERGLDGLVIAPASPREWLQDGKTISLEKMATYFGPMSFKIESRAATGEIVATVTPPRRNPPKTLEIRLRHPEKKPMKSVTVNGEDWRKFDKKSEIVRLPPDGVKRLVIVARY